MPSPSNDSLTNRIRLALTTDASGASLATILTNDDVDDVAVAMEALDANQGARIVSALGKERAAELLAQLSPELARNIVCLLERPEFKQIVDNLPPRDAARLAADVPVEYRDAATRKDPAIGEDAKIRAEYRDGSAGRLMTDQFIRLRSDMTIADALSVLRRTDPQIDTPDNLYVVESTKHAGHLRERLEGVISIRSMVMADTGRLVREVMATDIVTVTANAKDIVAANLLSKHKFSTLPVLDDDGFLAGVIPAEDLMSIVVSRLRLRYARAVGTDAEAMDKATPIQEAKMRLPWLLGTMFLELGAGLVIARFNHVLEKIILLASFMPVISAVAGNVGLQAAAITVRSLDSGQTSLKTSGKALLKEATVTLLMGAACAMVLGAIGVAWSKHWMFGLVIAVALGCSMLTACLMGTLIPMVSKKLGFDPATTAGPFETAFQDIIGFGVFLALATLLLR